MALTHFFFVVFVALGGVLVLRWRHLAWVHLPCVVWGALIEFSGWICPLTPLENWLRLQSGAAGYEGGFIEHYLMPVLYPADLSRQMQIGLGLAVVIINVAIYGSILRRRRSGRSQSR